MRILVIDGQGGGLGRGLIERLKRARPEVFVIAVGTNALATAAMLRAGADVGATGESAVCYNCAQPDVAAIAGPIGILMANAMYGELTPAMATAVGSSRAPKVLLPVARSSAQVVGVAEMGSSALLDAAVQRLLAVVQGE